MADEEGPTEYVKEKGWRAVAIPIKQYTGVRETTKKIPYMVFKHSEDCLKDEEECKSLLVDIMPIVGKNPMIRPSFGYEKIDVDLRQVPADFIRVLSNDYVYLTSK